MAWSGLVWPIPCQGLKIYAAAGVTRTGLVWTGLAWSGLVWPGLVWSGLVQNGLAQPHLTWTGLALLIIGLIRATIRSEQKRDKVDPNKPFWC